MPATTTAATADAAVSRGTDADELRELVATGLGGALAEPGF